MLDVPLIKFISLRSNHDRFRKYIKSHTILKETELLLADFAEYWKVYPEREEIDWAHFPIWFKMVKHPGWDSKRYDMYQAIFDRVQREPDVDKEVVDKFIQLDYTSQVRDVCDRIIRGESVDLAACTTILDKFVDEIGSAGQTDEDYFVTNNLKSILDDLVRSNGLDWRLEDLNIAVGPLHGGDFVIVGARPETGKTTFICSEFTHMVTQLEEDKDAIIFNNEEDGRKIFARLVQSANKQTLLDIAADDDEAQRRYVASVGRVDRIKVVHKDSGLSIFDVERYLKTGNYGLVGINVLDKLRGFDRDESEVSRMRKLAQFIRNLATKYKCAIVAVMQADASAEGKAWLDLSQLYGTKTGVQGEADVIIMVGHNGEPDTRYISVAKNKLPGGPRTKAAERHGKFEVMFDGERARYESKTY